MRLLTTSRSSILQAVQVRLIGRNEPGWLLSPLPLYSGITFTSFHAAGTTPCISDCAKMRRREAAKIGARRLYTAAGMPSGPAAEFGRSQLVVMIA